MVDVTIDGAECWACGEAFTEKAPKTMHHTLPRHLDPKHNVLVPVCAPCHQRITAEDPQALVNFSYKMMKVMIQQTQRISELVKLAEQAAVKK